MLAIVVVVFEQPGCKTASRSMWGLFVCVWWEVWEMREGYTPPSAQRGIAEVVWGGVVGGFEVC